MLIDCDRCEVRGLACDDCMVGALLGVRPGGVDIDDGERTALGVLADSGLVPPLRLVLAAEDAPDAGYGEDAAATRRTGGAAGTRGTGGTGDGERATG